MPWRFQRDAVRGCPAVGADPRVKCALCDPGIPGCALRVQTHVATATRKQPPKRSSTRDNRGEPCAWVPLAPPSGGGDVVVHRRPGLSSQRRRSASEGSVGSTRTTPITIGSRKAERVPPGCFDVAVRCGSPSLPRAAGAGARRACSPGHGDELFPTADGSRRAIRPTCWTSSAPILASTTRLLTLARTATVRSASRSTPSTATVSSHAA